MSPRYYYSKKSLVDDFETISVFDFKRQNLLKTGNYKVIQNNIFLEVNVVIGDIGGAVKILLTKILPQGEKVEEVNFTIHLIPTSCHLGGVRWWFICPITWIKCAKLYRKDVWVYVCRKAINLSYPSRNLSKYHRYLQKLFGPNHKKSYELYKSIKFPYRNGKPTTKMRRYLKMNYSPYTPEEQIRRESIALSG